MRILMAVPKYPFPVVGGLENQAHELAKALVRRGHDVFALTNRFDPSQDDFDVIDGVQVHRVKSVNFKLARFLISSFSLSRILYKLRRDLDLVHVHNISWFGAWVTLCAKASGLPVITKLPNIGDFGIPGIRRRPLSSLRIQVLKRSDAIVAMTPESLTELASIGYPMENVLKVPNGIRSLPAASLKRPRSPETVDVIYVGRLSAEKGLTDLLYAWSIIMGRAFRSARLRIIGDGPQANELRALALALELRASVEFLGHCENVPTELAKADVFVLPSYAEGNSNAILEAMRASLPIVATRVGGAAIQVGSEGESFLVTPGDRSKLAERILDLIEDDALRRRLGIIMRARIAKMFTISRIAAIYEQGYRLILSDQHNQIGQINRTLFARHETEDIKCAV